MSLGSLEGRAEAFQITRLHQSHYEQMPLKICWSFQWCAEAFQYSNTWELTPDFVSHIATRCGCPIIFILDQGRDLVCNYIKELCRIPQAKEVQTTSLQLGTELDIRGSNFKTPVFVFAHFTLQTKENTFAHHLTELCDNSILILLFETNVFKQYTTPRPLLLHCAKR